jgi:ABC-2 type transport system ATP-binding protein
MKSNTIKLLLKKLLINKAEKEKRNSLRFEVHVTEHCNLNCKSCGHMSPLAKAEFLDLGTYSKDVERLSYLCGGKVELVDLMGGEPLLHPQLSEIASVTREFFEGNINVA